MVAAGIHVIDRRVRAGVEQGGLEQLASRRLARMAEVDAVQQTAPLSRGDPMVDGTDRHPGDQGLVPAKNEVLRGDRARQVRVGVAATRHDANVLVAARRSGQSTKGVDAGLATMRVDDALARRSRGDHGRGRG